MLHQRLFPLDMSNLTSSPSFSTMITTGKGGHESRQQNWSQPLRKYNCGFTVKTLDDLRTLQEFHLSTRGSLIGFLIEDYLDYAVTEWTEFNETVTGSSQTFQLFKRYTDIHGNEYDRNLYFIENGGVTLQKNGVDVSSGSFTVNYTTGVVTYNAGTSGAVVTFKVSKFYVPVRFESDELPIELFYYLLSDEGFGNVPNVMLREVRYETVSSTGSLVPDTTAPTDISDLAESSTTSNSSTLTFTTPTDTSGIGGYEYKLNGGSWTSFTPTGTTTKSFTISGLSVGAHTVQVRSYDAASPANYSNASNTANTYILANYALASNGGSIATTDSFSEVTYPRARLIDGNTATQEWYSVGAPSVGSPHYQTITLSTAKNVRQIKFFGLSAYKVSDVIPQYYNGSTWVDIGSGVTGNTANDYTFNFSTINASQFRLKVTAVASGFVAYYEIQVWGY